MSDNIIVKNESPNSYRLAGWLAISSAALLIPGLILFLIYDIKPDKLALLLPFATLLMAVQTIFSIYALYRFKSYLNEYFDFHEVDILIIALICGNIAISFTSLSARIVLFLFGLPRLMVMVPAISIIVLIGIPTAICGIIFSVKLLNLQNNLHGLLKPLAYTNIAACLFFLTILLGSVGLLIAAACDVMLGIIFLKGKAESVPEFV